MEGNDQIRSDIAIRRGHLVKGYRDSDGRAPLETYNTFRDMREDGSRRATDDRTLRSPPTPQTSWREESRYRRPRSPSPGPSRNRSLERDRYRDRDRGPRTSSWNGRYDVEPFHSRPPSSGVRWDERRSSRSPPSRKRARDEYESSQKGPSTSGDYGRYRPNGSFTNHRQSSCDPAPTHRSDDQYDYRPTENRHPRYGSFDDRSRHRALPDWADRAPPEAERSRPPWLRRSPSNDSHRAYGNNGSTRSPSPAATSEGRAYHQGHAQVYVRGRTLEGDLERDSNRADHYRSGHIQTSPPYSPRKNEHTRFASHSGSTPRSPASANHWRTGTRGSSPVLSEHVRSPSKSILDVLPPLTTPRSDPAPNLPSGSGGFAAHRENRTGQVHSSPALKLPATSIAAPIAINGHVRPPSEDLEEGEVISEEDAAENLDGEIITPDVEFGRELVLREEEDVVIKPEVDDFVPVPLDEVLLDGEPLELPSVPPLERSLEEPLPSEVTPPDEFDDSASDTTEEASMEPSRAPTPKKRDQPWEDVVGQVISISLRSDVVETNTRELLRKVARSPPRTAIGDITNLFSGKVGTHQSLRNLLESDFEAQSARRASQVRELQVKYRMLNDRWEVHCQRMEKDRERRTAKRVFTPQPTVEKDELVADKSGKPGKLGLLGGKSEGGRRSNVILSEAGYLALLARLQDEDMLDPAVIANEALRKAATVPEQLSRDDPERKVVAFDDRNALVADPVSFYGLAGAPLDTWTSEEVDIFCKRYALYPKQFGKIARGLLDKTMSQCVSFYYRNKHQMDLRRLVKSRGGTGPARRRIRPASRKGASLLANLDLKSDRREDGNDEGRYSPPSSPNFRAERGVDIPVVEFRSKMNIGEGNGDDERIALGRFRTPLFPHSAPGSLSPAPAVPEIDEALQDADDSKPVQEQADLTSPALLKRKMAPPQVPSRRKGVTSYWTKADEREFRRLHALHGPDFKSIALGIGNKTEIQCRNHASVRRSFSARHPLTSSSRKKPYALGDGAKTPSAKSETADGDGDGDGIVDMETSFETPLSTSVPESGPLSGFFSARESPVLESVVKGGVMKISNMLNTSDEELAIRSKRVHDWFDETDEEDATHQENAPSNQVPSLHVPLRPDTPPADAAPAPYSRVERPQPSTANSANGFAYPNGHRYQPLALYDRGPYSAPLRDQPFDFGGADERFGPPGKIATLSRYESEPPLKWARTESVPEPYQFPSNPSPFPHRPMPWFPTDGYRSGYRHRSAGDVCVEARRESPVSERFASFPSTPLYGPDRTFASNDRDEPSFPPQPDFR